MEIGPANPVVKQFRMNTWSPDRAESSAQTEPFARNSWSDGTKVGYVVPKSETPPDTERPAHKLRTALQLPTIPPVTVELPEASTTRPSSSADNTPRHTQGGASQRTAPGLPLGGGDGLMSSKLAPPNGSNSKGAALVSQAPARLPDTPGPMTLGRPTLPTEATQELKQALVQPISRELPDEGPLTQGRPAPPTFTGLTALGIQSYAEANPPSTTPPPPPPLAEAPHEESFDDGTPRPEDDARDETQTRDRIRRALAQRATVIEENQARRADLSEQRQTELQARVAREAAAPPAHGAEAELIARHVEPPFDPEARASLSVEPRSERGRVARKDSILYDQVGASRRVQRSAIRAEDAVDHQREVGRREFEAKQRKNADAVKTSEARNEARRLEQRQRLEAADLEDIIARAEARKQTIQREFTEQIQTREQARQSGFISEDIQSSQGQTIVETAQHRRTETFNANVSTRATAVKERQRSVFELQLQYAEQRRFLRENPLNAVGDESTENLALSRTGSEKFQTFKADKGELLDRLEAQQVDKVAAKNRDLRNRNVEKLNDARERSENVRRRLASTYQNARQASAGESRGRL